MLRLSLLLFALLAAGCYDDAGVPAPKNDPLPEANLSPAGPLRAVRGYARAYRPGHRSRGAGHYVRRSGELLPLGRVAGRRNGRGADGRPGRPVSGLSSGMPHRGASSGQLCAVASEWCRSVRCLRREIMPWKPSVSVPCFRPVRRLRNRRCSPSRSPDRRFRRTCARHVRLPGADRGSDAASVGRGSDGLEMGRLSAVRGPGRKQDRHLYEHLCPVCGFGNSKGPVTLVGVLQYGNAGSIGKSYMIKMRDENDCFR